MKTVRLFIHTKTRQMAVRNQDHLELAFQASLSLRRFFSEKVRARMSFFFFCFGTGVHAMRPFSSSSLLLFSSAAEEKLRMHILFSLYSALAYDTVRALSFVRDPVPRSVCVLFTRAHSTQARVQVLTGVKSLRTVFARDADFARGAILMQFLPNGLELLCFLLEIIAHQLVYKNMLCVLREAAVSDCAATKHGGRGVPYCERCH